MCWGGPLLALLSLLSSAATAPAAARGYHEIEAQIEAAIDVDLEVIGPALLRLGWHSAATYSATEVPHGGTTGGATMRFDPESGYEENRGLSLARDALRPIADLHPELSVSDLWVLGSYVAVRHMGGPRIAFTAGRVDAAAGGANCPPEARLPAWNASAPALRAGFARMGLGDRELVALMGAHSVGHTYPENSGFPYKQWDNTPRRFDNAYYQLLLDSRWTEDYDDDDGEGKKEWFFNRSWIMLLSDYLLREDAAFARIAREYADDEQRWFADFAAAFKKLTERGLTDGCPSKMDRRFSCPFAGKQAAGGGAVRLPAAHPPVLGAHR